MLDQKDPTVIDPQLQGIRDEAAAGGNDPLVALCDAALAGDENAKADVDRLLVGREVPGVQRYPDLPGAPGGEPGAKK